ncbi:diphosphate--fructose-6-phosphate 1-phosphotransferase [Rhodocyclus tenuis]|uniref:6-phosphofructokinase n=1 Tax=Rhodocyclus gracilis TaxID=2929842 RepID=UPI001298E452|nr:6-phosphofructokinase [Rhodocyclus gracilis]MRD73647.1 diphosphate--fructose-6-phosphate 1-phosphotransferase [Rhodocyclus gracilis]
MAATAIPRNVLYAQSGGVTAVINASACGLIEAARAASPRIGKVFAARNGILGALAEDLIDTSAESDTDIARLRHTPGGAFGSCRYKLKSIDEQRAQYERLIEVFRAHDIGYFFYNGGGDSMDTANKVSQIAERLGYPLICVGVPKTVDNDLPLTDCCPGFGSVAKYVATSMREAGFDVASMARTSTKIFVLEVMGRHAGWITAACGLAAQSAAEPPHLLLFPEVAFDEVRFLARVKDCVERYDYCTIAVSEGLRDSAGRFLSDMGTRDAFGHAQLGGVGQIVAQLIKDRLGYKYHWALADYLQRAARHVASRTDVEQAYALGRAAVDLALAGRNAVMPVIERLSDSPYRWQVGVAVLKDVANIERKMPADFIAADGFGITDACRAYLAPLIEGEDFPPFRDGLPDYVRLQNPAVPRRLPDFAL